MYMFLSVSIGINEMFMMLWLAYILLTSHLLWNVQNYEKIEIGEKNNKV